MSEVYYNEFRTWSCDMAVEIIKPSHNPEAVLLDVKQTLEAVGRTFSRFDPKSLVSQLNNGQTITPTPFFWEVFEICKKLSELTSGKFNPHVDLASHGYSQSIEKNQFEVLNPLKPLPLFPNGIETNGIKMTLQPGTKIDFGGMIKGYISQVLAKKHEKSGQGIIINLGGDMAVRGKDLETDFFEISIQNPITKTYEIIKLKNECLSTSGVYKRRWEIEGESKHHILDSQKNQSTNSKLFSLSVYGQDGAICDALATAGFSTESALWKEWQNNDHSLKFLGIENNGNLIYT